MYNARQNHHHGHQDSAQAFREALARSDAHNPGANDLLRGRKKTPLLKVLRPDQLARGSRQDPPSGRDFAQARKDANEILNNNKKKKTKKKPLVPGPSPDQMKREIARMHREIEIMHREMAHAYRSIDSMGLGIQHMHDDVRKMVEGARDGMASGYRAIRYMGRDIEEMHEEVKDKRGEIASRHKGIGRRHNDIQGRHRDISRSFNLLNNSNPKEARIEALAPKRHKCLPIELHYSQVHRPDCAYWGCQWAGDNHGPACRFSEEYGIIHQRPCELYSEPHQRFSPPCFDVRGDTYPCSWSGRLAAHGDERAYSKQHGVIYHLMRPGYAMAVDSERRRKQLQHQYPQLLSSAPQADGQDGEKAREKRDCPDRRKRVYHYPGECSSAQLDAKDLKGKDKAQAEDGEESPSDANMTLSSHTVRGDEHPVSDIGEEEQKNIDEAVTASLTDKLREVGGSAYSQSNTTGALDPKEVAKLPKQWRDFHGGVTSLHAECTAMEKKISAGKDPTPETKRIKQRAKAMQRKLLMVTGGVEEWRRDLGPPFDTTAAEYIRALFKTSPGYEAPPLSEKGVEGEGVNQIFNPGSECMDAALSPSDAGPSEKGEGKADGHNEADGEKSDEESEWMDVEPVASARPSG